MRRLTTAPLCLAVLVGRARPGDAPVPVGPAEDTGWTTGCDASVNVRRYFLRWAGQGGWETIANSTEAGCGRVRTTEPAFPRKLCADLPRP